MRIVKICCSEWKNASRDKRELSVCRDLGMEVLVLAKGTDQDKGRCDDVDGFSVRRYSSRPFGKKVPTTINRVGAIFAWAYYARKLRPDIISGHDLDGLTVGWLANLLMPKRRKALLVYDSHEFEIGRNANRNKFNIWLITHWERFMMKRCELSIMVNESIADEVQRIHHLKNRPVVVRNIPNKWVIDESECQKMREELIGQFGEKIDNLLIYHGAVCNGRGLEDTIRVIGAIDYIGLLILGNVNTMEYKERLWQLIEATNTKNKVIFHEAVGMEQLWKYVGAADLGICNISPVGKSYYYALPNKLFENIQALTPVLVSDLPELRRIVEKYGVGVVCKADSVDDLQKVIRKFIQDKEVRDIYKRNALIAKDELCWEKERMVLIKAYTRVLQRITN